VDYRHDLEIAERAARAAGRIVAEYYARGEIAVELKADQSPVTQADRDANAQIVEILTRDAPDDIVVSEELPDPAARLDRRRVWIVDPLDGTRDFVARTGQFSVHVALAVDGEAVVGAVYQPTTGVLFLASAGGGAWRVEGETRRRLRVSSVTNPAELRVGVSRLNASARIWRCLAAAGLQDRAVAMGASVKHMAVADGALEAAINLGGGEQEWDTCAPEVVIREAGGMVTDADGQLFRYNQRDLAHHRGSIASNGACHAALLDIVRIEIPTGPP